MVPMTRVPRARVESLALAGPCAVQEEEQFVLVQGSILVCEARPTVELGVAAELSTESGHADESYRGDGAVSKKLARYDRGLNQSTHRP